MPMLIENEIVVVPEGPTTLVYGEPKTSKSRWFFEGAAAHHNVIYFDADNAAAHVKLVPNEHRGRFAYIPAYKKPLQALSFLATLCMPPFKAAWDENAQSVANVKSTMGDQAREVVTVDLGAANQSTLLVIDGWQAISQAVYEYFGTDIAENKPGALFEMVADRSDYKPMYAMVNGMLNRLKSLSNHTFVITWEERHIEYDPESIAPGKAARDAIITRSFVQPISVAHKHSSVFAGYFSQVLRFKTAGMGSKISSKTTMDQIAGGSLLPPMEHAYAAFPFPKYSEAAGLRLPEIQPITDVVRYTTLGEARTAKPNTGSSAPAAKTLLKPATTTVAS